MMKKFKLFVTLFVCALLTLTFAACGKQSLPTFSQNSFNVEKIDYWFGSYDCPFSFEVNALSTGKFTLEYDLVLYNSSEQKVASQHFEDTTTIRREDVSSGTKKITCYYTKIESNNAGAISAKLENFKATVDKTEDDTGYVNYAIGFGTVSAVLLGGVIGYFVWLKKKETKE